MTNIQPPIKRAEALLISGDYAKAMALCCELLLEDDSQLRVDAELLMTAALNEYRCFADIADALGALAKGRSPSFSIGLLRMRSHIELNEISAARQIFWQLFDMAGTPAELLSMSKTAPCMFEFRALYHCLENLLTKLDSIVPPPSVTLDAAIVRASLLLGMCDRQGFLNLISLIRQANPPDQGDLGIMQKMAARLEAYQDAETETPKVFCIGLSKTATTSLHKALDLLGYLSAHWINPVTSRMLDDEDIPLFDCLSDTPISYRFEELYHSYPNAHFIYSRRNPVQWEKSVLKHYAAGQRDRQAQSFASLSRFNRHARELNYGERFRTLNNSLYFNSRSFADAYQTFDQRVHRFFADKPASRFLEIDIFSGDGWNKLCPFLAKAVPAIPFPWEYKTRLMIEGEVA